MQNTRGAKKTILTAAIAVAVDVPAARAARAAHGLRVAPVVQAVHARMADGGKVVPVLAVPAKVVPAENVGVALAAMTAVPVAKIARPRSRCRR